MSALGALVVADPGRVGEIVDVRFGLRRRRGVVVKATADALDVQFGSKVETVSPRKIKARVRAASECLSAGGRIYATMLAASGRQARVGWVKLGDLGWDPELLWPAIEKSAEGDQALEVALDLIDLGDSEALTRFPLDDDSRSRLEAWQAHREGRHSEALELLLEADPRSADLPEWSIAAWMHRAGGPLVTRTELLPANGPGLVATVLHALSKGEKLSVFDLQAVSPYLRDTFGDSVQASAVVKAIEEMARGETTLLLADNSTVSLHRSVSAGTELAPQHASALADWPLSLTDDLIDAGRLAATAARYLSETAKVRIKAGPPVARRDYLLARFDPTALDDTAVVSLGFAEEAERRFLESGNPVFKETVDKSSRQRLEFMRSLREKKPLDFEAEQRLRSEDPQGRLLAQVSSLLRTGDAAGLSPELLKDGSVVELTAAAVETVDVKELPERLGGSVALRRAIDRLFCWDWEGAADQARIGLQRTSRESIRDELLNLLACALWEQGKGEASAAALEKAIEGQNNAALLANMRVVAANFNPTASHRRQHSRTESNERRNPYIILGVPYGTRKAEAARAFARATRRLKRDPDAPYGLSDLTWALHQVEQGLETLESADAIFRVPANAEVYSVCRYGLLRHRPSPMTRRTDPSDEELAEDLAAAAGMELLRHLLDKHSGSVTPEAPFLIIREDADS